MTMLKVPDHQVAGHKALHGKLGPLIDDSGLFYKPLQSGDRGSVEAGFYESFSSDVKVPDNIRRYFPKYHGTKSIEASDGSGLQPHLVLEDITKSYSRPSIIDAKIGARTWYSEASDAYIQKCFKKDKVTSSAALGFRLCGLQIYRGEELGYWKPNKKETQVYTANDVRLVLKKFVSSNHSSEVGEDPDCALASTVYGGPSGILAQLLELKSWFEVQTTYHLYSCSILMVYDKESISNGASSGPAIKLVDFAHVVDGNGIIDHNFVGGLCSLIKFISVIVAVPSECTSKDSPQI